MARGSWRPASGSAPPISRARARRPGGRASTARRRRCAQASASATCRCSARSRSSATDAAEFLNRVYCNAFLKLPVGRARYGLMLREDGCIYDDGTTSRLGETHYFMTTTTALAAGVLSHLEFCAQALWPELDVRLASATDQWAQMAVAGPKARETLARIVEDDLANEAFPYLAARAVTLKGGLQGPAVSHLLLGRARLRAGGAGGLWRERRRRGAGGGGGRSGSRPTARRPWACCASRRATSRMPRSTAR